MFNKFISPKIFLNSDDSSSEIIFFKNLEVLRSFQTSKSFLGEKYCPISKSLKSSSKSSILEIPGNLCLIINL